MANNYNTNILWFKFLFGRLELDKIYDGEYIEEV